MPREYKVVQAGHFDVLEASVTDYLRDGWEPQGGVALAWMAIEEAPGVVVNRMMYAQAMTRTTAG